MHVRHARFLGSRCVAAISGPFAGTSDLGQSAGNVMQHALNMETGIPDASNCKISRLSFVVVSSVMVRVAATASCLGLHQLVNGLCAPFM